MSKPTYTLTKTEAAIIESVRRLPTHCRAQTASAITEFVITFHSGMSADEQAAYAQRKAA